MDMSGFPLSFPLVVFENTVQMLQSNSVTAVNPGDTAMHFLGNFRKRNMPEIMASQQFFVLWIVQKPHLRTDFADQRGICRCQAIQFFLCLG